MINLLPLEYKKDFQREETFRLILILTICIGVFLSSVTLLSIAVRLYAQGKIQEERFRSTIPQGELEARKRIVKDMTSANENFSALSKFYTNRASSLILFDHLQNDVPLLVSLNSFSFSGLSMTLEGFAPTRDMLLEFRQNLQNDSLFEDVNFPLSNLAISENIHFSLQVKIRFTPPQ